MNFFKNYSNLPNYLNRKTIFSFKNLHIRLHTILCEDKTPYLHNHPFYFVSIILKNGYEEEIIQNNIIKTKKYGVGSIILRTPKDFHRIKSIKGITKTLFFTWKKNIRWSLKKHPNLSLNMLNVPSTTGVYIRTINGKDKYCKFDNYWFIGHSSIMDAENECRLSIHQCLQYS